MPLEARIPPGIVRIAPAEGQESVWDYPRPPRIEPVVDRIRVVVDGVVLADSTRALRVLETAGPPVYYLPPSDVRQDLLVRSPHRTICEWKGEAAYFSYVGLARREGAARREIPNIAWTYEAPNRGYEVMAGHVAFYAGRVDEAWVGDERATPQPGRFYGGWVTKRIVGPFKGEPGSESW